MRRKIMLAALAVIGLVGASPVASAAASTSSTTPNPALRYMGTISSGAVHPDTPVYDQCGPARYCINDWNGGTDIKSYAYNGGAVGNNKFSIFQDLNECNHGLTTSSCPWAGTPSGLPIVVFMLENGGTYNGYCIGDNGNSSTNASSGVVGCPSGSGTGGWGDNFIAVSPSIAGCSSGYSAFYNLHWNSSWSTLNVGLGTANGNGDQIYNNSDPAQCLTGLTA
jgi:hypothetical protein